MVGALLGCIPQCGFSVVASALYVKRVISVGTLLAVFLSTSDEAVPVLLSMPDKAKMVGVLIAIKVVIAIVAGVGIDYVIRVCQAPRPEQRQMLPVWLSSKSTQDAVLTGLIAGQQRCQHYFFSSAPAHRENLPIPAAADSRSELRCGADGTGKNRSASPGNHVPAGPGIADRACSQLFCVGPFSGALPPRDRSAFGALVAGLCAGGGLGILVLLKENGDFKDTAFVVGLLLTVSIVSGIAIQLAGTLSRRPTLPGPNFLK